MTPSDFIRAIAPAAQASAGKTGIPASFTIAQAALESGWGGHVKGNNLFGIKADKSWTGDTYTTLTHEVMHGQRIAMNDVFRAYPDWAASIDDHALFLDPKHNPRYAPAFQCTDGRDFAYAIAECGYATDPDYGKKISAIIHGRNLQILDTPHGRIA